MADDPSKTHLHILEPRQTDADKAVEYRARLRPLLEMAAAVMNEAQRDGMEVSFSLSRDQYGRWNVPPINVVRPL